MERRLLYSLIGVGVVAVVCATIGAAHPHWNWGDVPNWVNAITTLGALIAAGILVTIEMGRERRAEAAANERRQKDASAHQADYVAAWCGTIDRPGSNMPNHGMIIANGSPLPIYDIIITWVLPDGATQVEDEPIPYARPGESDYWVPTEILNEQTNYPGMDYWQFCYHLKIVIEFRDTAGRTWRRDENGYLKPA